MIDRKKLINLHNPKLVEVNKQSPLTVGNGELAFTADITGLQSLYNEYEEVPLCTMSQWGWHTKPVGGGKEDYTLADLVMTEYDFCGRKVVYPKKKFPGNEEVYDWLRHNPHRLNLARIGLKLDEKDINTSMISDINQVLDLYSGILTSEYKLLDIPTKVETACGEYGEETLGFSIETKAFVEKNLSVCVDFPYGSHLISASDWESTEKHRTEILKEEKGNITLKRTLDRDTYFLTINTSGEIKVEFNEHKVYICSKESKLDLTVKFGKLETFNKLTWKDILESSEKSWVKFWEKGGIIKLNESQDSRAMELERRIILSQYLMALNSSGSTPPQETGLTCNSWYGKMHLEMYFWHCAWLPLWGHTDMLERSVEWYRNHIEEAKINARTNGYKGARWPKMIATEGIDCPSPVAPLLVWQQPHIIFMLEMGYKQAPSEEFLKENWELINETAIFMVDFVVWNEETKRYDICAPVIPVQECHKETDTLNPAFELEYWRVTLRIATEWAKRIGIEPDKKWNEVADKMAELKELNGVYLAHETCVDTFTKYNRDHPSMLTLGILPSDRIDEKIMENTLDKVLECWDYQTMWGWDFAVMAMTAVRLNKPEVAIDIILKDTMKNCYLTSGNNMQISRKDLPLYLPGNGSLLIAAAMMVAGYEGCDRVHPGFPTDGTWKVEYENIERYI